MTLATCSCRNALTAFYFQITLFTWDLLLLLLEGFLTLSSLQYKFISEGFKTATFIRTNFQQRVCATSQPSKAQLKGFRFEAAAGSVNFAWASLLLQRKATLAHFSKWKAPSCFVSSCMRKLTSMGEEWSSEVNDLQGHMSSFYVYPLSQVFARLGNSSLNFCYIFNLFRIFHVDTREQIMTLLTDSSGFPQINSCVLGCELQ